MKLLRMIKTKAAIRKTAAHFNETPENIRREMCDVINTAWLSEDPEIKAFQNSLFPNKKPTPEEFIAVISNIIREA